MTNLLSCPFCGSPAELEHDNDHHGEWFNLGCSQHWGKVNPDEACPAGRLWYTELPEKEAEAIAAWNRRAPAQSINAEMLEAAETSLSWLMRWGTHVGNCRGGGVCTCGLTATRVELDFAVAIARAEAATAAAIRKGDS